MFISFGPLKVDVVVHDADSITAEQLLKLHILSKSLSLSTSKLKRAVDGSTIEPMTVSPFPISEEFMSALDDAIAALTANVAAETTVAESAITLIGGVQARIDAAVAAATAAGATAAQLQALTDLSAAIGAESSKLADAVAANTTENPNP